MEQQIQVSVICVTYNHEKYIKQALDSILMQETTFPFEILVGEDCSTDKTREILKSYEMNYPDKFHMYYREQNLGATKNEYELFMDAKGKYIAALELDDIWTDTHKLQKQYDFLESHDEYVGVSHDFDIINKDGIVIDDKDNKRIKEFLNSKFTLEHFLHYGFVFQTGTHFYRNIFKEASDFTIIYKADRLIRDKTILSLLLYRGDFFILPDNMSAYRRFFDNDAINGRNVTNANLELDLFTKAHHIQMLNDYFKGKINYSEQWCDVIFDYFKRTVSKDKKYSWNRFFIMYMNADLKTKGKINKEVLGSFFRKCLEKGK